MHEKDSKGICRRCNHLLDRYDLMSDGRELFDGEWCRETEEWRIGDKKTECPMFEKYDANDEHKLTE